MSLKEKKSDKLKTLEINKISYMVDCLKEQVGAKEPVTEEDKAEFMTEVEQCINTIMSYNRTLNTEPIERLD